MLLIFCLLFLSVPIALLSLWRNQEIGHDLVILPSQPVILERLDLWALNARPFLVVQGELMCSAQNIGDSVQLTAQFTFSDGSTTPMSALSNDHGCGTAAQMMLTSSKDFPRLKKIHSIELLSTVSMQHVYVVWHNAHP